ncbi:unnamed protein product [Auanema sp. JU1783]|nr:unnamed protein product [Auanema sp. JU1783]
MSSELQKEIERTKSCFGQLETDIDWIEYRSSRNAFYTTKVVHSSRNAPDYIATLHLLCTGNRMHSIDLRVIISHRNHHAPTFLKQNYNFYVPISSAKDSLIAEIQVTDNDPVIYNSERLLTFTKEEKMFEINGNGSIFLKTSLENEVAYRPIRTQVLAIDYGSPQLYSIVNLTIVPVTVSAVRDLSVNVATSDYQILQWDLPSYGHADRYRLIIRKEHEIVYEDELDGTKTKVLTKVSIASEGKFSYQLISMDASGQTPSDIQYINVIHKDLTCAGECSRGGSPLCFYGKYNRIEQFHDEHGAHCLCFPGFSGISCSNVATCMMDKTISAYGGVDWPEVSTNITSKLHCPYNMMDDSIYLERTCLWDKNFNQAIWSRISGEDQCKTQRSVLTHVGVLGTFLGNAHSVSTINTVAKFIKDLMKVPAFSLDKTHAHFDQKIAEDVTRLIDILMPLKIDRMSGNATLAKTYMFSAILELSKRLPVPISLSSPEHTVEMKALDWPKHVDNYGLLLGTRCRVNLPRIYDSRVIRALCMTNSTLFEIVNTRDPIVVLSTDSKPGEFEPVENLGKITILLKPSNKYENFTCVRYEPSINGWTPEDVFQVHHSYHGFVKCEVSRFGIYSILPEKMFEESNSMTDISALLPSVTTICSIMCSIFLLFMAAAQRNQTIDVALLVFLFFVFLLNITHLVMVIAPQVGDPFAITPALHLLMQFSILSISSSLYLVIASIRDVIIKIIKANNNIENNNGKEELMEEKCCSRPFTVVTLCFILPAILTFSSYIYTDESELSIKRFMGYDWLFIGNFLFPTVFFCSLSFAFTLWNVYIGSSARNRNRASDRYLAISPAVQSSVTVIFQMCFLYITIVTFYFRKESLMVAIMFSASQILYSIGSFIFGSYIFRVRFEYERDLDGSYHSLERKRDISRALLEHIDARHIPESNASIQSSDNNDLYLHMSQSLYDRQPMVSIV